MDEVSFLILLNFSIGFGSYVAGTIPMIFQLSESKIRTLSVFGAGILMGTALCVIIPEGVNSIYESSYQPIHHHSHNHEPDTATSDSSSTHRNATRESTHEPHSIVGITLLCGFVMMLIIDQFSSGSSSNSPHQYNSLPTADTVENGSQARNSSSKKKSAAFTATVGLMVHSAADGIAMGAAATTAHADVEMIVFLAILMHKAPASFGFVSYLLSEGIDRSRAKRYCYLASFVTYFGISASAKEALSYYNATGISLLFSAGTFLYVAAVHVLPEITQHQRLKCTELLYLIVGSFLPPLLTFNHHH
ncbi:hypothetical protein TYRP_007258 [Tyrophagus putrescentiae]|nr:hypothetical protein TYRP_007258 [Tyrophagus putrescentiae]